MKRCIYRAEGNWWLFLSRNSVMKDKHIPIPRDLAEIHHAEAASGLRDKQKSGLRSHIWENKTPPFSSIHDQIFIQHIGLHFSIGPVRLLNHIYHLTPEQQPSDSAPSHGCIGHSCDNSWKNPFNRGECQGGFSAQVRRYVPFSVTHSTTFIYHSVLQNSCKREAQSSSTH